MQRIHRELILQGKCDKAPGQKNKQYIYQLAECIQLKPVQATKIHLEDSIIVHFNIKQNAQLRRAVRSNKQGGISKCE